MLVEHERNYDLGMDALGTVRTAGANCYLATRPTQRHGTGSGERVLDCVLRVDATHWREEARPKMSTKSGFASIQGRGTMGMGQGGCS